MSAALAFLDKHLGFMVRVQEKERNRAILVLAVTFFGVIGFSNFFGVFIDTSELRCLPERVYIGYPKLHEPRIGDIVSFVSTEREALGIFRGHRLAKIVMAQGGDRVVSDERGVFINGKFIADRSPVSLQKLKERKLDPININRVLQPGELFLMGTLPRSFDSRYWGVVPDRLVERYVLAVI
ncbi:S26 family signal peptidase [Rhodoferax antarcticus]|uniref:Peptidase S26 domain-containing protein n=1 Tax=Rhodoferax antarcticus ANT.BR TaxID=1111071 RepID=A0A1Q8Y9B1_9BURK|nr:S26 family signal peptidase [Rhodoferax antarcticus]OLP04588.1 hypothetical protein BLL52_4205 [Rhodoferax antarcticus ANT.BR]